MKRIACRSHWHGDHLSQQTTRVVDYVIKWGANTCLYYDEVGLRGAVQIIYT